MNDAPKCEVCEDRPSVAVVCVPGMPVSAGYCAECLAADAHPWHYLVANTALLNGLENAAPWFVLMVDRTCKYLGRTREQFDADVRQCMADMP